jgi:hypothetical protein
MDFVKINFTPDRIKYIIFDIIKNCVFENNGIIYGGFVRDMIIRDHYKAIYNKKNEYNIHKFWNIMFQPETAARAIVPKDMDICMYSEDDIKKFIISIENIFNEKFGYANITSVKDETVNGDNSYFDIPIKMHKKVSYVITVGKIPFVHRGVELHFDFDIIIPRRSKILPPFNKLDLLSNAFILNKTGVVISNNTGTCIDNMSIMDKQIISASIMKDIVEFKTQFCMWNYTDDFTCGNYNYNNKVVKRLNKMLFRNFKWNITNLPFLICDYKDDQVNSCNNNCTICLSKFKKNEKIIKVFIDNSMKTEKICCNMSTVHDKCLFKYFETQLETGKYDGIVNSDSFELRCPSRNIINFKLYADNISDIIREKIK